MRQSIFFGLAMACTQLVAAPGLAQTGRSVEPVEWTYIPSKASPLPLWWKQTTTHAPGDPSPNPDPAWVVHAGDEGQVLRVITNDYSRSTLTIAHAVLAGTKLRVKFRIEKERGLQSFAVVAAGVKPDQEWHAGVMWVASKPALFVSSMSAGQWAKPKSEPIDLDVAKWHTLDVSFSTDGAKAVLDNATKLDIAMTGLDRPAKLSLVANAVVADVSELALLTWPQNTLTFDVTGMHCEMCEANIEGAIEKIKGVKKVTSSYKTGLVSVEIDPASPPSNDAIIEAIKALKYGATVHTPGTAIPATPEPAAK